jgi:TPR repeat protein
MRYDLSRPFDYTSVDVEELQNLINAEPPDPSALYVAAVIFYEGLNRAPISGTAATECVERGMHTGDDLCKSLYGVMWTAGQGITGHKKLGLSVIQTMQPWVIENANAGHVSAQRLLGVMYMVGAGVPKDPEREYQWFLRAADQGDALAIYSLGLCHKNPQDRLRFDLDKAQQYISQAAEMGVAHAQLTLFDMHAKQKKPEEGLAWLIKSAEQGRLQAQYQLARWYAGKLSPKVPVDQAEAFAWTKRAADNGYIEALLDLATRYETGLGTDKNRASALGIYFALLERRGHTVETTPLLKDERVHVEKRLRTLKLGLSALRSEEIDGVPHKIYVFNDKKVNGDGKEILHVLEVPDEQPSPHPKARPGAHIPK